MPKRFSITIMATWCTGSQHHYVCQYILSISQYMLCICLCILFYILSICQVYCYTCQYIRSICQYILSTCQYTVKYASISFFIFLGAEKRGKGDRGRYCRAYRTQTLSIRLRNWVKSCTVCAQTYMLMVHSSRRNG